MGKIVVTVALLASLSASGEIESIGSMYIKMLGTSLKKELKSHIKNDKTALDAFGFCSTKAQAITAKVNKKLPKGVTVRRSALKLRNMANRADKIDLRILREFQKELNDKNDANLTLKVVQTKDAWRVYKPLIIKPLCLKCHGRHIDKEVMRKIAATYPKDSATGYRLGEFRGVVIAEIKK